MITIQLNYLQLLIAIAVIVISSMATVRLLKILIKIIFTSKSVMAWNLKRQIEQQKLIKKTQHQTMHENLINLGKFMDWIDKHIPSHTRKQFYRDFAYSKETREYWIKTLLDQFAPEKPETPKAP